MTDTWYDNLRERVLSPSAQRKLMWHQANKARRTPNKASVRLAKAPAASILATVGAAFALHSLVEVVAPLSGANELRWIDEVWTAPGPNWLSDAPIPWGTPAEPAYVTTPYESPAALAADAAAWAEVEAMLAAEGVDLSAALHEAGQVLRSWKDNPAKSGHGLLIDGDV